jgi:hypothetical protein
MSLRGCWIVLRVAGLLLFAWELRQSKIIKNILVVALAYFKYDLATCSQIHLSSHRSHLSVLNMAFDLAGVIHS